MFMSISILFVNVPHAVLDVFFKNLVVTLVRYCHLQMLTSVTNLR